MDNALMNAYAKQVAAILEETGHPLREEVMEEVRCHLSETFARADAPQSMEALVERLGSPEEVAASLAPAQGYRKKPWVRRKGVWIAMACAVGVFVAAAMMWGERHTLATRYREARDRNFFATPFFDLDRMRNLQVGASADEIRNAIGYPLRRYQLMGPDQQVIANTVYWEYTNYPSRHTPFYTSARLVTDLEDMRLLRLEIHERMGIGNPPEERFMPPPVSVRVGAVTFSRPQAPPFTLRPDSDRLAVISLAAVGVGSEEDLSALAFARREAFITTGWTDVPRDRVVFIYLVQPKGRLDWPALHRLLEALPPESHIYTRMETGRGGGDSMRSRPLRDADVVIYCQGTLHRYPVVFGSLEPKMIEAYQEDQNWLIHRLLDTGGDHRAGPA